MSEKTSLILQTSASPLFSQMPDDAPESAKRYPIKLRRSQSLKKGAFTVGMISIPLLFIGLIELFMFWILGILTAMFYLPCLMLGGGILLLLITVPLGIAAAVSAPSAQDRADYETWLKETDLKNAKDLETAGRYEAAALIYERHKMFKEAGTVRAKNRDIPPPPMDDPSMISYLLKMRKRNKATSYECPNCGANIKISGDTQAKSLQKCEYCGSSLEVEAINIYLSKELE